MCLLPQNQLLCQQAAIPAWRLGHISIHILSLIRIESGLVGKPRPPTRKYGNFLTVIHSISMYMSAVPNPAHVPAHRLTCNVARSNINACIKFDED